MKTQKKWVCLNWWMALGAFVAIFAGSARGQFGTEGPEEISSFAELRNRADDAWAGSATVAMYPPGMSFTNALPVFAVANGFDPAFLAGLRETQTAEGIVLRTGLVRETAGANPERQWFGAGAAPLAVTALPQGYDPVAWVLERFPPPAGLSPQQRTDYIAERRLSRQAMAFTLIAEADVPAYLAARAARIAAMPAGRFGDDDLGLSGSAYDPVAKALRVLLVAPKYAGTLGVFETKDLLNPFPWALLATLPNPGGVVEFVYPNPPEQGVFRLVNLFLDSDLDGIADAVEELMLGTDAHAWDSAGDGISDWDRVFRLDGATGAGGVPLQVSEGLGLPEQDMTKVVGGPVELHIKAWRTEREKNGCRGYVDDRTRFLGLEEHYEYVDQVWNTRYFGNTASSALRFERNDRVLLGGVLHDEASDGELTPLDNEWLRRNFDAYMPWGPVSEFICSNTEYGTPESWYERLSLPYTDRMLLALAGGDLSALRANVSLTPQWDQMLVLKRPAEWGLIPGSSDYGYLTSPTLQQIPATRGALEHSAFRLPEVLAKPGQPDVLGGIELQAIAWQAASAQIPPAGHILRGVVLEVHRDPAPEGVAEGTVTRVVPREVFLKQHTNGSLSPEFTLPPPARAGSAEVVDGYSVIELLARENAPPGCADYRLAGRPVRFRVTGLGELARLRAHRVAAKSPEGGYPMFRKVGTEVWHTHFLEITEADLGAEGAMELEVLPDVGGLYTVSLEAVGGARNDSGEWESSGPGVEISSASFLALRFHFLPESTQNFAPSAWETARFTVAVEPPPPAGGYAGLHVNVHVERRLNGGSRQHIQHLDAAGGDTPGVVAFNAPLVFEQRRFTWNGRPIVNDAQDPDPAVIASGAEGPETFGGLDPANPVRRVFPVVNIGECVPPSTYHVVVRIMEGTGDLGLFHSESWAVGVAQVVRVTMTEAARLILLQPQVLDNGTVVAEAMPEGMVDGVCKKIANDCNDTYAGVNIRFRTGECRAPYSSISVAVVPGDEALGRADTDWLNENPDGSGLLNSWGIGKAVVKWWLYRDSPPPTLPREDWESFPIPISPDHRLYILSGVAAHEAGHLLGLVAENGVMSGAHGWHNPSPWTRRRFMNPGGWENVATGTDFIGASGPWGLRAVNFDYLRFVLPIVQNEEHAP